MDQRTAEDLDDLLAAQIGYYLRADKLARLLTRETVSEIMDRLPLPFRDEFVRFAREVYAPHGKRLAVAGLPLPEPRLEVLREWLAAHDERTGAPRPEAPRRMVAWAPGQLGVDLELVDIIEASGARGSSARKDARPIGVRVEFAERRP